MQRQKYPEWSPISQMKDQVKRCHCLGVTYVYLTPSTCLSTALEGKTSDIIIVSIMLLGSQKGRELTSAFKQSAKERCCCYHWWGTLHCEIESIRKGFHALVLRWNISLSYLIRFLHCTHLAPDYVSVNRVRITLLPIISSIFSHPWFSHLLQKHVFAFNFYGTWSHFHTSGHWNHGPGTSAFLCDLRRSPFKASDQWAEVLQFYAAMPFSGSPEGKCSCSEGNHGGHMQLPNLHLYYFNHPCSLEAG